MIRISIRYEPKELNSMNNSFDGGEAILQAFRNLNIDYVICSPGSEWPPFWEAIARQKRDRLAGPAYIDCGHEIVAVSMAAAYTNITGRMQSVMLHAGAGILQGSMAISAARAMETPMLIMSGESSTYGVAGFDPGSQWYRNLSVVGGPQRLLEPVVKWAQQAPAPETLYQTVVRAGELAQRAPKGPTYVCVSMETMLHDWLKPDSLRIVPPAPKTRPSDTDIHKIALLISKSKCPVISALTAGPDPDAFAALIELADVAAIPVFEGQGAFFANFPKSHELYQGSRIGPLLNEIDLALLVDSWAPWYPPGNTPRNADIVAISENPLKPHMVYQTMEADHYLEGNVAATLRLLSEAVRKLCIDPLIIAERRSHWGLEHRKWRGALDAIETSASQKATITPPLLMKVLREVMPANTTYVDETIVHAGPIREHAIWEDPNGFFRAPSGLGQGLGYALGVKLALPDRHVVMTIGDGTFLYNPVIPALTCAASYQLPLLIIICNNKKYAIMEQLHNQFYPQGTSSKETDYYGVHINSARYEQAAEIVGGYGQCVEKPEDLKTGLEAALASIRSGRSAILNVIMADAGVQR
jgi:acetolactate synthase-1/2/3 large subunit